MSSRSVVFLLTIALVACLGSRPSREEAELHPSRFVLVSLNGQPLPVVDSLGFARVLGGAIEFYHAESLRVIHVTRDLIEERLPCEALRALADVRTGGIGAVSDTSTTGCDELRLTETDTHRVAYERRGIVFGFLMRQFVSRPTR